MANLFQNIRDRVLDIIPSPSINPAEEPGKGRENLTKQIGFSGEALIRSYQQEEVRVDDLKIQDYRRMIDNDGQLQMVWNAISNTILAPGVNIIDDPDYEGEEDSEELAFIKANLLNPRKKNGMSRSMDLTNRTNLRAFIEGYRVNEVVYRLDKDGKVRLDKLAPRAGGTDAEFKIVVNKHGEFIGFHQKISWGGKGVDVTVVNDTDIKKAQKVTFGEEFGSNYGRSGFRAAWYHYDKVHKGMFLNHVGHELGVVKPREIRAKQGLTEDQAKTLISAFDRLHLESTVMYNGDLAEVNLLETTDAKVMEQGKAMIDLHYSLIAKSLLAQFIDLGSQGSNTGSRALGESQTDFFKNGLQSIAQILIADPWNSIIEDIVDINFARGIYPRLVVKPISDQKAMVVMEILMNMSKNGTLPESMKKEVVLTGAEALGLDVNEETLEEEMEKKEEMAQAIQGQPQPDMESESNEESDDEEMSEPEVPHVHLGDGTEPMMDGMQETAMRPLYLDEQKVKLVDIKRRLDDSKARAEMILGQKLREQRNAIVNQFVMAMREGRKKLKDIEVELAENDLTYREELREVGIDMLEYGKRTASNELSKSVPTTPKKEVLGAEDRVDSMVDQQETNLKLRMQSVALDALEGEVPENEATLLLEQEYDNYWSTALIPTVGLLVSKMFNIGRKVAFDKYAGDIFAFRYTAVLDANTTNYCRELDGRVFQGNDPNFALLTPPQHFGCRSFWTPIMKGVESEGVVVEGKPADLPVYGSVSTFRDV